jgi:hypothetical protein
MYGVSRPSLRIWHTDLSQCIHLTASTQRYQTVSTSTVIR